MIHTYHNKTKQDTTRPDTPRHGTARHGHGHRKRYRHRHRHRHGTDKDTDTEQTRTRTRTLTLTRTRTRRDKTIQYNTITRARSPRETQTSVLLSRRSKQLDKSPKTCIQKSQTGILQESISRPAPLAKARAIKTLQSSVWYGEAPTTHPWGNTPPHDRGFVELKSPA